MGQLFGTWTSHVQSHVKYAKHMKRGFGTFSWCKYMKPMRSHVKRCGHKWTICDHTWKQKDVKAVTFRRTAGPITLWKTSGLQHRVGWVCEWQREYGPTERDTSLKNENYPMIYYMAFFFQTNTILYYDTVMIFHWKWVWEHIYSPKWYPKYKQMKTWLDLIQGQ